MGKLKKRITDSDVMVTQRIHDPKWFSTESAWFKEQIEAKKALIKAELIEEIEKKAMARDSNDGLYHLKDICEVLDWIKERDKEERNRLAFFSNKLQILHGADGARMLWGGLKAILSRDDIVNPTDMFLSKKEARKGRKRRRAESKHGVKAVSAGSTDKKAARQERARIRKEAKRLGISTKEYKEKMKAQA